MDRNLLAILAMIGGMMLSAHAEFMVNGDFEAEGYTDVKGSGPFSGWTGPTGLNGNLYYNTDSDNHEVPDVPNTVIRLSNNTQMYQTFSSSWGAADTFTVSLNACEVFWESADAGNGLWVSLKNPDDSTQYFSAFIDLDGTHGGSGVTYESWQENQTFVFQVSGAALIDGTAGGSRGSAAAGQDLMLTIYSKADSDSINWIDNVSVTLTGVPQPDIWLDAGQGLHLVGGCVAAWTNLAAPGTYDAVQAAASKRPALMYETWPGHQVIHFDGTDDILSMAGTAGNALFEGELTVFYVGRTCDGGSFSGSDSFVGNFQTGNGIKNGWSFRTGPDGTFGFVVGNGAWNEAAGGTAQLGDDFVLLNGRYSDGGDGTGTMELFSSLLDDPSTLATSPFTPSPSSADISIGMFCGWTALTFTQAVECDVAEVRIFGRALSDIEREAVWNDLSAKYDVATGQAVSVVSFQPTGYEEPVDTPVEITFNVAMDPDSMTNVIVGIGGLDGLPEGGTWTRAAGQWAAAQNSTVFTFTADPAFEPGDLVLCEVPSTVHSASGTSYDSSGREIYSFIVDNGVSYGITTTLIDPMAIVYHDNGDEHVLPLEMHLPSSATEPCPVMFWVHGGGWNGGGGATWERSAIKDANMAYYYADKLGVAVANVAWRAQTDSGGTFTKVTGDISQAIQHVIDNAETYNIDTARMGLYGGSAGTPTSALVAQANTNISCYIGFNGLYDFVSRGDGSFGGGTGFGQNDPSYAANSAALNVRANPPDSLFLHGSADTTIEHGQSEWFADAIKAEGGTAEALIYRDEVHAFFNIGWTMHLPTMHASGEHLRRVFNLGYSNWAQAHGLSEGAQGDDDGDSLSNLCEYGLGGDPTDPADTGIRPVFEQSGETMRYIHVRRTAADSGITYSLELTDNLVSNVWENAGFIKSVAQDQGGAFESVTNEISTRGSTRRFARLKIVRK